MDARWKNCGTGWKNRTESGKIVGWGGKIMDASGRKVEKNATNSMIVQFESENFSNCAKRKFPKDISQKIAF